MSCLPANTVKSYWVGVASREHVRAAVEGAFCQLSHGKEDPVRKLKRGDHLVFYSPRERLGDGEPVQAFTAIGQILDDAPFQIKQADNFHPFRRKAHYPNLKEASIHPLLEQLSFTQGRSSWGMAFRRGTFKISWQDFDKIERAMKACEAETKSHKSGNPKYKPGDHSQLETL